MPPDSKETKLGTSNQEASPSAGKNTRAVLVPRLQMEVCPYSNRGLDALLKRALFEKNFFLI